MAFQLRPLVLPIDEALEDAIDGFDCCGDGRDDDEIAHEVNAFLREGGAAHGIEHTLSSTYLWLDDDARALVGYLTLSLDSVRLTDGEKKRIGRPDFPDISAVRLVMIGIDHRRQGQGVGSALLQAAVGLAREVASLIAVRFMVADVNPDEQAWYANRKFEINRSKMENDPDRPRTTISMRLDLVEEPHHHH